MNQHVMGIDVGSTSVRAGLFTTDGTLLASAVEPIRTWRPQPDYVEQASEDIWNAAGRAIRSALATAGQPADSVAGISFDATCSLVVLDTNDRPLAVNEAGDDERNVIVWMDHRATAETDEINQGRHDVLKYVGGRMSPEMETPKLLWLKRRLPRTWDRSGKFLDLADFLTYRATGNDARSLCTVVCKWTYLGHDGDGGRWDEAFFAAVGLGDLFDRGRVSRDVRNMGSLAGNLTERAAAELGLTVNCAVGIGIIDAHAGGLGLLGAALGGAEASGATLDGAVALIGGTSNCHMAVSEQPRFIDGVWGPYFGAMVPGLWLTEGGQSSAGSAIDHVIENHANAASLRSAAEASGRTVYELLNAEIDRLRTAARLEVPGTLTADIHVLADFLGNRSPHSDPGARGSIDGLSLDSSITSQAILYYATIQSVAYGTRSIINAMNASGYAISTIMVTGGGTRNPLWLQEHADATGMTLVLPREPDAVLLGAAMLAAAAAGVYPDVRSAMAGMSAEGARISPNPAAAEYHSEKFIIYEELYSGQVKRRDRMARFRNSKDAL